MNRLTIKGLSLTFLLLGFFTVFSKAQVNVAVDMPVEVDSETSNYPSWKAVDGLNYSNSNRWVSDDNGYPHWIEVDLMQDYKISMVKFFTGEYGTNYPIYDYQIQYQSGETWTDIISVSSNTSPEVTLTFDPVICSKVRLYASSGEGNKLMLYELEVYAELNQPPVMDEITDPEAIYMDADVQTLLLTGIDPVEDGQNITISAASYPAGLLTIVDITYTETTGEAILRYQPEGTEGTADVTLTVQDDGGSEYGGTDTLKSEFQVEILDPDKNYPPTFSSIADKILVADQISQQVYIKAVSDGDNNEEQTITFNVSETGNNLLDDINIQYSQGSDYALLSYSPKGTTGNTTIRIIALDDSGSKSYGTDSLLMDVNVEVVDPAVVSSINVDYSEKLQLMQGFGAFGMEKVDWAHAPFYSQEFIDLIIEDLGLSILRIPLPTDFESVNDNDDPDVFNWEVFRAGLEKEGVAKWIDYLKDMAPSGPEKLIVSVWSPPAWMKTNGSTINGGRLMSDYYEEYAEYIAAFITLVKEESGLDIYAVSLQNEPTFSEPYASCQYTPAEYVELIKVVGARLEKEGIGATFFYPEEVFVRSYDIGPWMDALNGDAEAAKYVDIMALHGYDTDGIASGTIGNDMWELYYNNYANHSVHPKEMWMTESSGTLNQWEGGAFNTGIALSNAINFGKISAWIWWQISTESSTGSEDPAQNTSLLVNGEKLYRYYMFKQFYRYIRPGAWHVESESSDLDVLVNSFIDMDESSTSHVLINRTDSRKIAKFNVGFSSDVQVFRSSEEEKCEEVFSLSENIIVLPPKSITTIYDRQESGNHAPTIDPVNDTLIYANGQDEITIGLSGISDGEPDLEQKLDLSVYTSDSQWISDLSISYNQGEDTAVLSFLPVEENNFEIEFTITVSEEAESEEDTLFTQTNENFKVSIFRYLNNAPYMDDPQDVVLFLEDGTQEVLLSGLQDGDEDQEQNLSLEVENNRPECISVTVDYSGGSDAKLLLTPLTSLREDSISIILKDDGGTTGGGTDQTEYTLGISIESGSSLSVKNSGSGTEVKIYPIPVKDNMYLTGIDQIITISLIDPDGRIIRKVNNPGEREMEINCANIPPGIYFLVFTNKEQELYFKKIIKQ